MRVVVTGASGSVGTALLRHVAAHRPHWSVLGICRRPPWAGEPAYARTSWVPCDLADAAAGETLRRAFDGADAVVHAAWAIQPSRQEGRLERVNVEGTHRVLAAAQSAGVAHVVHLSSVGAYSPGEDKVREVEESWPTDGVPTSSYSRHKSAVERLLDERGSSAFTVTRLRPGLIFQRDAASAIARYFLGPLLPQRLAGAVRVPVLPVPDEAVFQVVHAADVAAAVLASVERAYHGPLNLATPPTVTPELLAAVLGARRTAVPARTLRAVVATTYAARLQPTHPGWLDLAFAAPVMATDRARQALGWAPAHDASAAFEALRAGLRSGAGTTSPVLRPPRQRRRRATAT